MNNSVKTTTHYVAEREYQAVNSSGNAVDIDMYSGDQKQHQSPTELLLSALAACASVDLVQILNKRKKTVTALTVEASGQRTDTAPRRFTAITLRFVLTSPDVGEEELQKMATLAATKYCSIAATLNAPIDHAFELIRA